MTDFSNYINNALRPNITEDAIVLDLFAGCGGFHWVLKLLVLKLLVMKWFGRLLILTIKIFKGSVTIIFCQ